MSTAYELTAEQLLEYAQKIKTKMKKLEVDINSLREKLPGGSSLLETSKDIAEKEADAILLNVAMTRPQLLEYLKKYRPRMKKMEEIVLALKEELKKTDSEVNPSISLIDQKKDPAASTLSKNNDANQLSGPSTTPVAEEVAALRIENQQLPVSIEEKNAQLVKEAKRVEILEAQIVSDRKTFENDCENFRLQIATHEKREKALEENLLLASNLTAANEAKHAAEIAALRNDFSERRNEEVALCDSRVASLRQDLDTAKAEISMYIQNHLSGVFQSQEDTVIELEGGDELPSAPSSSESLPEQLLLLRKQILQLSELKVHIGKMMSQRGEVERRQQEEVRSLKAQLESVEVHASQQIERDAQELAALKAQLQVHTSQQAELSEQEVALLKAELRTVEIRASQQAERDGQELEALRAQLAAATAQVQASQQADSDGKEIATLKAQLSTAEAQASRQEEQHAQKVAEITAQLETLEVQAKQRTELLEQEVERLKDQLVAAEASISQQTVRYEEEVAVLRSRLEVQAAPQADQEGQEAATLRAQLRAAEAHAAQQTELLQQEVVALKAQLETFETHAPQQGESDGQEVAALRAQLRDLQEQMEEAASAVDRSRNEELGSHDGVELREEQLVMQLELLSHLLRTVSMALLQLPPKPERISSPEGHYEMDQLFHDKAEEKISFELFPDTEQRDDRTALEIVVDCNSDPSSTVAAAEILLQRLLQSISDLKVRSTEEEQVREEVVTLQAHSKQPPSYEDTDTLLATLSERVSILMKESNDSSLDEAKLLAASIDGILRPLNGFIGEPAVVDDGAVAKFELKVQELSAQLQKIHAETDELASENAKLQQEKLEIDSLRESLQKQVAEVSSRYEEAVAKVAEQSRSQETDLGDRAAAVEDAKAELSALTARLEEAEADRASSKLKISALEVEKNAFEQREEALKVELVGVRGLVETLQSEVAEALASLEAAKKEAAAAIKVATDIDEKLQRQLELAAALTSDSAAMKELSARHEKDLVQLRVEKQAVESLLETQRVSLLAVEAELSTASILRDRLQGERLTDKKNLEALSATTANLTSDINNLQSSIDQLRQELSSTIDREQQLKDEVKLKSAHLDAMKLKFEEEKGTMGSQLLSENAVLSNDLAELRRKSVAEKSRLEEEAAKLLTHCAELQTQLKAAAEQNTLQEATNKKLMTKLKAKMKELSDLTSEKAQQGVDREDAFKSDKDKLERQIAELQSELDSSSRKLSHRDAALKEFELKVKQCTEREIASEERISSLLREKNKFQEDSFQQNNRIEFMVREAEQLRSQLSISEQNLREATNSRDRLVEEDARNRAQSTLSLNSMLGELDKAKQQLLQQQQLLKEDSKRHAMELQSVNQQSATDLAAAQAKIDSLNEKVKALKVLLQKVNNKAHEKDSKVSELMLLNERPKRFRIIARLSVLSPKQQLESDSLSDESSSNEMLPWCLIFEDSAAGATSSRSPVRWIEESQVQQWRKEGSVVAGTIPQPLQESWEYSLSSLRSELEQQREDLTSRLDEVNAAYQAYKLRAQSALKRIGNEERNEKQRAHEHELSQEVERLKATIKGLESEVLSLREECIAAQEALRSSDSDKASALEQLGREQEVAASLQDSHVQVERRLREVTHEMELLRTEKQSVEDLLQESAAKHTALLQQYNIITFDMDMRSPSRSRDRHTHEQPLKSEDFAPTQSQPVDEGPMSLHVVTATATAIEMAEVVQTAVETIYNEPGEDAKKAPVVSEKPPPKEDTTKRPTSAPELPSSTLDTPSPRPTAGKQSPRAATTGTESVNGGGKMLLHYQADSNLKESLSVLRKENSALMMEMIELRNDISLRDEQANALKSTIRELESSILREREFNAASRRINADYLVNILRNFLMSGSPSERSKLVPVLCTILHLQPDEAKLINEKWMVKTGGLVGWLLPTRPMVSAASSSADSDPRDDGQMDVMTAPGQGVPMSRGGANNKRAVMRGDLSYDPVTGSGVGVGGMDIYA